MLTSGRNLLALFLTMALPATATATSVTQRVDVDGAKVIYRFTVSGPLGVDEAAYNDFHIRFERIDRIDVPTAVEDVPATSVVTTENPPGCAPPCGELVFTTNFTLGYGAPTTFSVTSVEDPRFIEGPQAIKLTRDGEVKRSGTTSSPTSGTHVPGATNMSFPNGSFAPGSQIQLLQTPAVPANGVSIGNGTATGSGAASIPLARALTYDRLHVCADGVGAFVTLPAATPSVPGSGPVSLAAIVLGLILIASMILARRDSVASKRDAGS